MGCVRIETFSSRPFFHKHLAIYAGLSLRHAWRVVCCSRGHSTSNAQIAPLYRTHTLPDPCQFIPDCWPASCTPISDSSTFLHARLTCELLFPPETSVFTFCPSSAAAVYAMRPLSLCLFHLLDVFNSCSRPVPCSPRFDSRLHLFPAVSLSARSRVWRNLIVPGRNWSVVPGSPNQCRLEIRSG